MVGNMRPEVVRRMPRDVEQVVHDMHRHSWRQRHRRRIGTALRAAAKHRWHQVRGVRHGDERPLWARATKGMLPLGQSHFGQAPWEKWKRRGRRRKREGERGGRGGRKRKGRRKEKKEEGEEKVKRRVGQYAQAGRKAERFRGPSGRTLFSDEGGFTFNEAPFEGTLHEDLKGASPSKDYKRASPSEEEAWRGLEGGFKGASRGWKPSEGEGGFEGLEGGLKGVSRGLEKGFKGASPSEGSRGLEGGLKRASRELEGSLKPRGLKETWRLERDCLYCACIFFRGTFSSEKRCLFLALWKISRMINI